MDKAAVRSRKKAPYRTRTHLIHGSPDSKRWDYNHHVIPPLTASTTYRLSSAHRGEQGFIEFAQDEYAGLDEHAGLDDIQTTTGTAADNSRRVPIYIYDRLDEPTRGMLEENLAYAEGGETAICFATGMAAISAALGVTVKQREEIITHQIMYGCTYSLLTNWLPRAGIRTRFVDLTDPRALCQAITDKTRVVFFETPVNPTLQLIDISAIRSVLDKVNHRRKHPIRIIVDNTFATPYCQRPLEHGADIIVHSLTKDIGGFGTDMGGAVIASRDLHGLLMLYRKDFGGVLSSKSAWAFLVYGLPTLATRLVNQQKSAMKIASFLEQCPYVAGVSYPGLESFPQRPLALKQMVDEQGRFAPGFVLYFTLKKNGDDNRKAEALVDYLAEHSYTITLAVSLGQIKTLIENPYAMTHAALPEAEKRAKGIEPGGIRLSVGLEDWHDIIGDLKCALNHVSQL